ncbi:Sulfate transport system permease protein CysW [Defluviimonas aquaemixtae]|uniref:Sulfate transport system permease protein CysW n=1 Tax=Albidovulum aquaemixtae TaxID=1542388 RepID=A0A2R8BK79_9RHOB|nr:thiamine/thiamine pyrophosphate ABC transporter permease ThiP [Defluviimonas aquaemixtae]SPH23713.1 Sulfate transport system permease protein CysW [Defluviimonas aquaemixtae]
MAVRAQPLSPLLRAGAGTASTLVLALVVATLGAVVLRAGGFGALGPGDWAAIRFTVIQAAVSAALSLGFAIPVARALARRKFSGRAVLITLLGAPFILPVIVAVMGILAIFGRAGLLNDGLAALGFDRISIYGFSGVVLAHVFFNLPLAVRLLLQGWLAIPAERFRLAAALGFGPAEVARFLERPMLRTLAPGVFVTIFLICLTSFAVALTLGGGPRATTVELAIYQAFRFDFDLGRAARLATIQLMLCAAAAFVAARLTVPSGFGTGLDRAVARWDAGSRWLRLQDAALLTLASLFLLLPIFAVLIGGLSNLPALPAQVWQSAVRSLTVALAATALSLALALPLALAIARSIRTRMLETIGMLPLATSALVMGTGLFLMLRPMASPSSLALPTTIVVNAAMALPFCLRALMPSAREIEIEYGRLAQSLGLTGFARLRLLTLPRLRRPLGFAAGLTAALSMGDLGVIALFADADTATLPLQMYRLMGAYRMGDASGAAVLLLALSLALFWGFDRGGRADADA